jgi:hypothetical protein
MHEAILLAPDIADALDLLPDVVLADRIDHFVERQQQALRLQRRTRDRLAVRKLRWAARREPGHDLAFEVGPGESLGLDLDAGFFASKRRAMSLNALMVCGSVSVCQTRTTFCACAGNATPSSPAASATAAIVIRMSSSRPAGFLPGAGGPLSGSLLPARYPVSVGIRGSACQRIAGRMHVRCNEIGTSPDRGKQLCLMM